MTYRVTRIVLKRDREERQEYTTHKAPRPDIRSTRLHLLEGIWDFFQFQAGVVNSHLYH
jgi:hypothetical protein